MSARPACMYVHACLMLPLDKCNMSMDVPSETDESDEPRE